MLNLNTRQGEIFQIIKNCGSIKVHDLLPQFNASAATIRKDLTALTEAGLIYRTHGEVHLAAQNDIMLPFESRCDLHAEAKRAIARAAVREIQEGDSIILDSGSTTLEIAKLLGSFHNLTVITNSLPAILAMNNTHISVSVIGGTFLPQNLSIQGPESERYISQIEVDKAFICSTGVRRDIGLVASNSLEGRIKHCMLSAAHRTYAVLDSAKFTKSSIVLFADFEEIDCIITEKPIQDAQQAKRFQELGTKIIIADT